MPSLPKTLSAEGGNERPWAGVLARERPASGEREVSEALLGANQSGPPRRYSRGLSPTFQGDPSSPAVFIPCALIPTALLPSVQSIKQFALETPQARVYKDGKRLIPTFPSISDFLPEQFDNLWIAGHSDYIHASGSVTAETQAFGLGPFHNSSSMCVREHPHIAAA